MSKKVVSIPRDLALRPRQHGFPVPVTSYYNKETRKYDFRVVDLVESLQVAENGCCALCGKKLGILNNQLLSYFVGGPGSFVSHQFTDSAMHRRCALYAIKVCPFIVSGTRGYVFREGDDKLPVIVMGKEQGHSESKPDAFMLALSHGYSVVRTDQYDQPYFIKAWEWQHVEWWRHGQKLEKGVLPEGAKASIVNAKSILGIPVDAECREANDGTLQDKVGTPTARDARFSLGRDGSVS